MGDLAHELSLVLGFNYTIKLVDDGKYGSETSPGNWNGMLGEVWDDKSDFVIADISITSSRASAFAFTIPWMNLGISIPTSGQGPPPPPWWPSLTLSPQTSISTPSVSSSSPRYPSMFLADSLPTSGRRALSQRMNTPTASLCLEFSGSPLDISLARVLISPVLLSTSGSWPLPGSSLP